MAHQDDFAVDPKVPHAFKERLNLPYQIPRGGPWGPGVAAGPELPFRKGSAPDDCELCSKRRSDPIHAASEQEANDEHWPV
jgi:hypothetical protein